MDSKIIAADLLIEATRRRDIYLSLLVVVRTTTRSCPLTLERAHCFPRALAGLSDHDVEIQRALQYRALELYDWWPDEQPRPEKPDFYPSEWRDPLPDPATVQRLRPTRARAARGTAAETQRTLEGRIRSWAEQPGLNAHKIIAIVVAAGDGIGVCLTLRSAYLTLDIGRSGLMPMLLYMEATRCKAGFEGST